MSSQTRQREREESRRLSMRTLVIAFIAASVAGVVTSQFWLAGTWVATGLTPVLVALVTELLHRPTEVVTRRITRERTAPLPAAGGPAPPPPARADPLPERAPSEPGSRQRVPPEPPVQVYGQRRRMPVRRRVAIGAVAVTAMLAFAAAALAITGVDLISGGSIGKGSHKTTLFGGHKGGGTSGQQPTTTTPTQTQQAPQGTTTSTTPKTTTQKKPQQTTPSQTTPSGNTNTSP
jgi:hypothetical protein